MTPQQKLKEIEDYWEKTLELDEGNYCRSTKDVLWLISRIKVLEEALEKLVDRVDRNGGLGEYKGGPAFALKDARKALAGEK